MMANTAERWLYQQPESSTPTLYNTTDNDPDMRASSGSPSSADCDGLIEKPDISIFCEHCNLHIDLRSLAEHRKYHQALAIMKYRGGARPESPSKLLQRRRAILRRLKMQRQEAEKKKSSTMADGEGAPTGGGDNPSTTSGSGGGTGRSDGRSKGAPGGEEGKVSIDPDAVQAVNEAYEFLKADLEETFEALRRIKDPADTDVRGTAVGGLDGGRCVLAVGTCATENERWKSSMEDRSVFVRGFGGDRRKAFVGLYDGHHGSSAAQTSAAELHHALLYLLARQDPSVTWRTEENAIFMSEDVIYDDSDARPPRPNTEGNDDDDNDGDGGGGDDEVRPILQVIRGYEEKMERLRRQEEKEREAKTNEDQSEDKENARNTSTTPSEEIHKQRSASSQRHGRYSDAYSTTVAETFREAYRYTDLLLSWGGREENSRVRWSGCSALTCLLQETQETDEVADGDNAGRSAGPNGDIRSPTQPSHGEGDGKPEQPKELGRLHLAHAGNVSCVLVRGNRTYRLTKDHTPKNPRERARIMKAGGTISDSSRHMLINGVLSATRGLGNHGDKLLRRCVTSVPYTTVVPLDEHSQFLVMATEGVWQVFSEEEAAQILLEMLPCNQLPPPSRMATSIQYLLAAKSRSHSVDTSHVPASELIDRLRAYSSMTAASVPLPEHLRGLDASPDFTRRRPTATDGLQDGGGGPLEDIFDDDGGDGESGNEADLDTCLDHTTIPPVSRMSLAPPTREEIHSQFAKVLAERLVQAAVLAGSKDNVSVIVVLLAGCGL